MSTETDRRYPFASIDLQGLDAGFGTLLERAEALDSSDRPAPVGVEKDGLSPLEASLFRLGAYVGLAEWEFARSEMSRSVDSRLLSRSGLERAVSECVVVMGETARLHLREVLESWRVEGPANVRVALEKSRNPGPDGHGLTDREVFALGLGIACGARCWDT